MLILLLLLTTAHAHDIDLCFDGLSMPTTKPFVPTQPIRPLSNIPVVRVTDIWAKPTVYFSFNAETGIFTEFDSAHNMVATYSSLIALAENHKLTEGFFPYLFDRHNPQVFTFGFGADTLIDSSEPLDAVLLRNGGHAQLAQIYRREDYPILDNLYGGGFYYKAGSNTRLEYRSRSLNRALADGELPEDVKREIVSRLEKMFQPIALRKF